MCGFLPGRLARYDIISVKEVSKRKAIHVIMVTDLPLAQNAWSKEASGFVSSDDLFAAD